MHRAIIFNGPPRSGKDTGVNIVRKYFNRLRIPTSHISIAQPMKDAVHKFYGLSYTPRALDLMKDKPLAQLGGSTLREEYIAFSEMFIKPRKGLDFFGNLTVDRIKKSKFKDRVFLISDCGFNHEYLPLQEYLGVDELLVVKLIKESTNFQRDSRDYIDPNGSLCATVINHGTMEGYKHTLETNIKTHFLQKILKFQI